MRFVQRVICALHCIEANCCAASRCSPPRQLTHQDKPLRRRLGQLAQPLQACVVLTLLVEMSSAPGSLEEALPSVAALAAAAEAAGSSPASQGGRITSRHLDRHEAYRLAYGLQPEGPCGSVSHEYGADIVQRLKWIAVRLGGEWPGGECSQEEAAGCAQTLRQLFAREAALVQALRRSAPNWPHVPGGLQLAVLQQVPPPSRQYTTRERYLDLEHPLSQPVAPCGGYHQRDGMGLMPA